MMRFLIMFFGNAAYFKWNSYFNCSQLQCADTVHPADYEEPLCTRHFFLLMLTIDWRVTKCVEIVILSLGFTMPAPEQKVLWFVLPSPSSPALSWLDDSGTLASWRIRIRSHQECWTVFPQDLVRSRPLVYHTTSRTPFPRTPRIRQTKHVRLKRRTKLKR